MDNLNVKLTVSYDGTNFYGFQHQNNLRTIEDDLKNAISKIANEEIVIHCAGRTDTGVHAEGQVINFHTTQKKLPESNWIRAINSSLQKDIRITNCEFVPEDFHARRSAIYREYRYQIVNARTISALWVRYASHYFYHELDPSLLQNYGNMILGENDFTSFCATSDSSLSKSRYIHTISVNKENDIITIKVVANAFLQHMIRIIVGTMLNLNRENQPPEKMKEILLAKDRNAAGQTYYPTGLVFKKVYYDESVFKKNYVVPKQNWNVE
jgi:tRNA pseudouridine38-40 synthase